MRVKSTVGRVVSNEIILLLYLVEYSTSPVVKLNSTVFTKQTATNQLEALTQNLDCSSEESPEKDLPHTAGYLTDTTASIHSNSNSDAECQSQQQTDATTRFT